MPASRTVSVVVVSRHRPQALCLCLTGLAQLDHADVEVIVVACPAGLSAARAHPLGPHLKCVACDTPNISLARNRGIAAAAGEIVAFIDDDAVPEPLWLHHLVGPFDRPEVAASGGHVIGRNGISFQWTGRAVHPDGTTAPIRLEDTAPQVLHPGPERAIKTEGTNMALRRDVLADLGGFDPAFRFYMDETDLNMRLAGHGLATALVPLAQVHHGFAPSARRDAARVPRDLHEIGASIAVFLRKHCDPALRGNRLAVHRGAQRKRLLRLMQQGALAPDDVLRLMRGFARGLREGQTRDLRGLAPMDHATEGFRPIPTVVGAPRLVLSGRPWQRKTLLAEARKAARAGRIVSLFLLSPTSLYHRVRFHPDGFWLQTGGSLGRAVRDEPLVRFTTFRRRVAKEASRVAPVRGT